MVGGSAPPAESVSYPETGCSESGEAERVGRTGAVGLALRNQNGPHPRPVPSRSPGKLAEGTSACHAQTGRAEPWPRWGGRAG